MKHVTAFLALIAPFAVHAQDFAIPGVTADPGIVLNCVASGKGADVCLGAMTLDCMAENDLGNENLEERLCVNEESLVWRNLMNRAGSRLRILLLDTPSRDPAPHLRDPATLAFEAEQRWQFWAKAQCRLERAVDGHGDRRAITQDTCLRDLAAARYAGLQRLIAHLEQG